MKIATLTQYRFKNWKLSYYATFKSYFQHSILIFITFWYVILVNWFKQKTQKKYIFVKKATDQFSFSFEKNMHTPWSQRKSKTSYIFYY